MSEQHDISSSAKGVIDGLKASIATHVAAAVSNEGAEQAAPDYDGRSVPEGSARPKSGLEKLVEERSEERERDQDDVEGKGKAQAKAKDDSEGGDEEVDVASAEAGAGQDGVQTVADVINGLDGLTESFARANKPLAGDAMTLADDGAGATPFIAIGALGLVAGGIAILAGGGDDDADLPIENGVPVAADDAATVAEGGTVTGNVSANDSDPDGDPLVYTLGGEVAGLVLNGNGSFSFDASGASFDALAAGESQIVSATITASDGEATDTSVLTITVTGTNDAPVAVADVAAATEGAAAVSGSVATNDSDVDATDVLAYALDAPVAGLTLNADGSYSFDPANAAYNGLAQGQTQVVTANYTVSDGKGGTAASTLTITVTGTNDAPVAVADVAAATEGAAPVTGSVATNDSDADTGAVLTYALNAPVAGLTLNADGSYSFDASNAAYQSLAAGETTEVVANYTVTDEIGANSTSTLTITVTGVNAAPVITSGEAFSVDEDAVVGSVVFTAEATDADAGDVVVYSLGGDDADLFAIDASTGVVTLAAPLDFEVRNSLNITLNATDAAGAVATQDIVVAVNDVVETVSLDFDSDTNVLTPETFDASDDDVTFSDSAAIASNAEVSGFGVGDTILVDNDISDWSFSSVNDGSSSEFDDLVISVNVDGVVSRIVLQDAIEAGSFVFDEASAEEALGSDFFASGDAPPPPPPPPPPGETVSVDTDDDTNPQTALILDADDSAFLFTDDADVASSVLIQNVSGDDRISILNSAGAEVSFTSGGDNGTDLIVSIRNEAGEVSRIVLEGAVSADAFISDEASAEQALGESFNGGVPLDFFQFG